MIIKLEVKRDKGGDFDILLEVDAFGKPLPTSGVVSFDSPTPRPDGILMIEGPKDNKVAITTVELIYK
jgi:hypothetical protein